MEHNAPESLDAARIAHNISTKYTPPVISVYPELDSTNSEAKRMPAGPLPALILAEAQTAGRGRLGRSFYSPRGTGLYMSAVLDCPGDADRTVMLTSQAAAAVSRAIEALTDAKPMIKWVNDIYIGGKKVCGILAEGIVDAQAAKITKVIIGIGVNITTETFPDGIIAAGVGSLDRNRLAAGIYNELNAILCGEKDWLEYYKSRSLVLGREISYTQNGCVRCAAAVGIDENGALVVKNASGTFSVLRTGEITVRLR